jgi:hypothetical protein
MTALRASDSDWITADFFALLKFIDAVENIKIADQSHISVVTENQSLREDKPKLNQFGEIPELTILTPKIGRAAE